MVWVEAVTIYLAFDCDGTASKEEAVLRRQFQCDRCGAFGIVVLHLVHSVAHRIASHLLRCEWSEQLTNVLVSVTPGSSHKS